MHDEAKQNLASLYEQVGQECPFVVAHHLGIHVSSEQGLGAICGWYYPTVATNLRILLNSEVRRDYQIHACEELILHHLQHEGKQRIITLDQFKRRSSLFWHANQNLKTIIDATRLNSLFSFSK